MKKSLVQIKDFVRRTQIDGEPEGKVYREIFNVSDPYPALHHLKESEDYSLMLEALVKSTQLAAQKEYEHLQLKKVRAQADLIDRGSDLLNEAETLDEKIKAQENQRKNLSIDNTVDIYASNRNQQDYGDVLEGIIL